MADIKIYGKLVANTEDQVVADASSIQDTARNQKLSVTLAGKQDTLTAGDGISIENNVISTTGGGGSAGGGNIDIIELTFPYANNATCVLILTSFAGDLETNKNELNTGIQSINQTFSLSIPLMTDLDSLSDLLDYLNDSNNNVSDLAYDSAMAGFFLWISKYALTSKIRLATTQNNGGLRDVEIIANTSATPPSYQIYTLEKDSYTATLYGNGSVTGTADGDDSTGNPVSLSVNGSCDVSVDGTIYTVADFVYASSQQHTKFASLVARQGTGSGSSESTGMQRWRFTFDSGNDVYINVYTKFSQSELSSLLADTNDNIDTINTMMSISLNHISSFNDIGTLITQSQTIDSTGALAETLIGTFMSGLCNNKKTISILQDRLLGRRTVVNCYPTINNQMATNFNCVVVSDSNQFVTLQIVGTNAGAGYEEI